ncbi:MAG TPA: hypothetical protein VGG29_20070 [Caulobacteraceae bacterium]
MTYPQEAGERPSERAACLREPQRPAMSGLSPPLSTGRANARHLPVAIAFAFENAAEEAALRAWCEAEGIELADEG